MRARALILPAALIVLAIIACYAQVLGFKFVSYDDALYVTQNPYVKAGLTVPGVRWAFSTRPIGYWHPLTWLSLMLDATLLGPGPAGFHAVSVLIHAANSVLLLGVLFRMTGALWRSAFVAAVFALHPLHAESVAWVAAHKDVLSTLFGFLALWTYVGYTQRPGWLRYALVAGCMIASLLAKPVLVSLPCVLLLLDYWPLRRWAPGNAISSTSKIPHPPSPILPRFSQRTAPSLILEKLPLAAISLLASVATFRLQNASNVIVSSEHAPLRARVINTIMGYGGYLRHTVWPAGLCYFYPLRPSWPAMDVAIAIVTLAGLTLPALALWKRTPALLVGWCWYLGVLVPMSGLIQVGAHAMADRYTYVPLVGLGIMAAWALPDAWFRLPARRAATGAVAVLAVGAMMFLTWRQAGTWHDELALCNHALAVMPDNYLAFNDRGADRYYAGEFQAALDDFDRALAIHPSMPLIHYARARDLVALGRKDEALAEYRVALSMEPHGTDAPVQIASLLDARGQPSEALAALQSASQVDPGNIKVLNALGLAYATANRPTDAAQAFDRSLAIDPDQPATRGNLGTTLDHMGKPQDALEQYLLAIQAQPHEASFHVNAGNVLIRLGRYADAVSQLMQAQRDAPQTPALDEKLGLLLLELNKPDAAATHLREACRERPDDATLHNALGEALARQGRIGDAAHEFGKALRLQPDLAAARSNLRRAEGILHAATSPAPQR